MPVPRARPAASGPWWVSTQWSSARRRGGSSDCGGRLDHPAPIARWPSIAPLLADPELGPVGELARLADVVQERRRHQQVGVEPRVQLADLADQRADRDGVLEQPAEVGVVAGPGAGRAPELGGDRLGEQDPLDHRPQARVVDLAGQVLEEALELLGRAVGGGQELGRVDEPGSSRRSAVELGESSPRKRSTLPATPTASPRSKRAPSWSASRKTRAGIEPVRSRSSRLR